MNTFGWKKIFKFTFIQTLKTKAYLISTILVSALIITAGFLTVLLPGLLAGGDETSNDGSAVELENKISAFYLVDTTGITAPDDYKDIAGWLKADYISSTDESDIEKYTETVRSTPNTILITVTASENAVNIYAGTPEDSSVSTNDAGNIANAVSGTFAQYRLIKSGIPADKAQELLTPVITETSIAGEEVESPAVFIVKMAVPMLSSLVLFIMIFAYGQMVAQSIAMEKTSRVMELLLTSVRPLAVIIGKILAMGLLSLTQFILFILSGLSSVLIALPIAGISGMQSQPINEFGDLGAAISETFSGISILSILAVLVIFIVGFIFYSLIAGLIGASVNRTEDLNTAMQPYALIGVVGFYLAYFPKSFDGSGSNAMSLLAQFLPLSSPFALPSAILTGEIEWTTALLSILVLVVSTVLLALLVARVYEQIIFHTGNRLKLKDILGLAKNK